MSLPRSPLKRGTSQLKRTPIKGGTKKLQAYAPLVRRTPLRAATALAVKAVPKPARRRPAVPVSIRALLVLRSGGFCEVRLPGCLGEGTETSHRIKTGSGGRHGAARLAHDVASNTMNACHLCHVWVETRRAAARELGLALKRHEVPSQVPVLYCAERLVFLCDEGAACESETPGVHDAEVVGT